MECVYFNKNNELGMRKCTYTDISHDEGGRSHFSIVNVNYIYARFMLIIIFDIMYSVINCYFIFKYVGIQIP